MARLVLAANSYYGRVRSEPILDRDITLGELLRTLVTWADEHGGLDAATLPVVVRDDPTLMAANLVDVLSHYIHGEFLEGKADGQPLDDEGHQVVLL